jgi:hypothetical protein
LASVSLFCGTNVAGASDYQGYVQNVVQDGTTVFVSIGNGHYGTVNCGSGTVPMWLYFDTTAAGGASYVAMILSAKMTGNQIYVKGNGVCFSGNTPNGNISEALSVTFLL